MIGGTGTEGYIVSRVGALKLLSIFTIFIFTELSYSLPNEQETLERTELNQVQSLDESTGRDFHIEVKDNLLSVELIDAAFPEVINLIAEKSDFEVEFYSDFSEKILTTTFNNIDLERGIVRLLTLIREKNYMVRYDKDGNVSKLEIYGQVSSSLPGSKSRKKVRSQTRRPVYRTPTPRPSVNAPKRLPVSRPPSISRPPSPTLRSIPRVVPSPAVKKDIESVQDDESTLFEKEVINEYVRENPDDIASDEVNEVKEIPYDPSEKMRTYKKHMRLPPKNK